MQAQFDHEKLDVYRASLASAKYAFELAGGLKGNLRHARDQLIRASQSVLLNIAEGNGKRSIADRNRYFEIARGSARECAAILDVLLVTQSCCQERLQPGKALLLRIISMLYKMTCRRGQGVQEDESDYAPLANGSLGVDDEHDEETEIGCDGRGQYLA